MSAVGALDPEEPPDFEDYLGVDDHHDSFGTTGGALAPLPPPCSLELGLA